MHPRLHTIIRECTLQLKEPGLHKHSQGGVKGEAATYMLPEKRLIVHNHSLTSCNQGTPAVEGVAGRGYTNSNKTLKLNRVFVQYKDSN